MEFYADINLIVDMIITELVLIKMLPNEKTVKDEFRKSLLLSINKEFEANKSIDLVRFLNFVRDMSRYLVAISAKRGNKQIQTILLT